MGAVPPTPSFPLTKTFKCILLYSEEQSGLDLEGWVWCFLPTPKPQHFCPSLTAMICVSPFSNMLASSPAGEIQ